MHQPHRLREVNVFDVGHADQSYFSSEKRDENAEIFRKVSQKSYKPMLNLLLELVQNHRGFQCAFSISGVFLEQAEHYDPAVLELIQKLVKTGKVELIAETYYHSLAALHSPAEFRVQVQKHRHMLQDLFDVTPRVFRNTELIYSNDIAAQIEELGYDAILTEAVDRYLHGRSKTQLYYSKTEGRTPLLLKHAELSDDIAFRFSDRNWSSYPLNAEMYADWVEVYPENEIVNLFMDFETFGEHQWEDTGIFNFWRAVVARLLERSWNKFVTPSEAVATLSSKKESLFDEKVYDVPDPISWADVDRDITAWQDNELQQDTLRQLYGMEETVLSSTDRSVLDKWRNLQTSDHFYYMCTKWSADGDVHSYFSPYTSPYEAYRRYCIILADLQEQLL
ncbi:MAG: glycoside hydrolase family 57 protein [Patescibacteria group bacterium]